MNSFSKRVLKAFDSLIKGKVITLGQNKYKVSEDGYLQVVVDEDVIPADLTVSEFIQMAEDTK